MTVASSCRAVVTACIVFWLSSASAFAQAPRLAVVVGLAGDPEHGELFQRWASTLVRNSCSASRDHPIAANPTPYAQ